MNNSLSLPRSASDWIVRNALLIISASAIIAIAAQIAIPVPFSPVPLTMQPLAVLLVGVFLGARRGAAAAALYLLEGASGMPVFSQGHGGAMWLVGATGGYLMSYPFAAFVAGSSRRTLLSMFAGLAVIYAGGFAWLSILAGPAKAFTWGVVPFVIADVVKVVLGAAIVKWSASYK